MYINAELAQYLLDVADQIDYFYSRKICGGQFNVAISKIEFTMDGDPIEMSLVPNDESCGFDIRIDAGDHSE